MALMLAPILLNICCTAGWVVELGLMIIRRHRAWTGPALLICGTLFSLGVAALPTLYWAWIWLIRTVRRI